MEIKLDNKHYLCSDKHCCWIEEVYKGKDGNACRRLSSGYTANFEDAVMSYIKTHINRSDATKIIQLAKEVKALKKEVRGWNEAYYGQSKG